MRVIQTETYKNYKYIVYSKHSLLLDQILLQLLLDIDSNYIFYDYVGELFKSESPYKGIYSFSNNLFIQAIYLNN
jgi:hypothetical protein